MPGWYSILLLLLLSWQGSSSLVPYHGLLAQHRFSENNTTFSRAHFPQVYPKQNVFTHFGVSRLCYILSVSLIWSILPFKEVEIIPLSLWHMSLSPSWDYMPFFLLLVCKPSFICLKQNLQKTFSSSVYNICPLCKLFM